MFFLTVFVRMYREKKLAFKSKPKQTNATTTKK